MISAYETARAVLSQLSPSQWAALLVHCYRQGGVALAIHLIAFAPPDRVADLHRKLLKLCPGMRPANDP